MHDQSQRPSSFLALVARWRELAAILREEGYSQGAEINERRAAELEDVLKHAGEELLTPKQAAEYSGYQPWQLRRMMVQRRISNCGVGKHARYRRSELPTKASPDVLPLRQTQPKSNLNPTRKQIARAVVNRQIGAN